MKRAPQWAVQSRFRMLYIYIYMYVCQYVGLSMGNPYKKDVCQNAWGELRDPDTRMLKVSLGWVKQCLATLKRLKRGDENELERKLRLETATKWLRLAMEMDEERKARLEKMVATTQLRLALETEEERRATLEHLSDNPIYY